MSTTPNRLEEQQRLDAILDRVYATLPPGANYGQISRSEAEFLAGRVLDQRPRHVLEIGTAAGVSTSVVLDTLLFLGGDWRLTAVECLEHCYFDASKRPGFILDGLFPKPPANYALHTGRDSFDLEELLGGQEVDLAFIDGNHTHPWATIDTLLVLPFLAPGATIVYHDINLHHRGGAAKVHDKGPHHLFYNLPAARKLTLGEFPYPNIGALRLAKGRQETFADLREVLLGFPWEAQAWPALDTATLDRLCAFCEAHYGPGAGGGLADRLKSMNLSAPGRDDTGSAHV